MTKEFIDYSKLVDEAMHVIVKKSLTILSNNTYHGDHHFFISFITNYPAVEISEKLRKKYPNEMTIVLQYQFEELKIFDDFFSVVLSFDNIKEKIVVPFSSLTAFADPSVKFGLQFRHFEENISDLFDEDETYNIEYEDLENYANCKSVVDLENMVNLEKKAKKKSKIQKEEKFECGNIISLDKFRKKYSPK